MEKVKVTQEQSDWLDKYVTGDEIDYALDYKIYRKLPDSPIADWKTSKLARALYKGYEVEPKFKEGDWVIRKFDSGKGHERGKVFKITSIQDERNVFGDVGEQSHLSSSLRHATPEEIAKEKERRWWNKHGREVWELHEGDILRDRVTDIIREVRTQVNSVTYLKSSVSGLNLDATKKRYRVACFAEDRQDV